MANNDELHGWVGLKSPLFAIGTPVLLQKDEILKTGSKVNTSYLLVFLHYIYYVIPLLYYDQKMIIIQTNYISCEQGEF